MAHGPVNSAWRVCLSASIGCYRISQTDYDILRKEYPELPITIDRDGPKVTKCIHFEPLTEKKLIDGGYVHQNGRSWYRERNVIATEYDE